MCHASGMPSYGLRLDSGERARRLVGFSAFGHSRRGLVLLRQAAVAGLAIFHVLLDLAFRAVVSLLGAPGDLVPDIDGGVLDALAGRLYIGLEFFLGVFMVRVRGVDCAQHERNACERTDQTDSGSHDCGSFLACCSPGGTDIIAGPNRWSPW